LPVHPRRRPRKSAGAILKDICIPDDVLAQLQEALLSDKDRQEEITAQQRSLLQQRLAQINRRIDQAYMDKLDGRISDEFWSRKSGELAGGTRTNPFIPLHLLISIGPYAGFWALWLKRVGPRRK
jgi:hypothetical protein